MLDVDLLDGFDLAKALQDRSDLKAFVGHEALPGVVLVTGHVVVGMVTGHDHQGLQDDGGEGIVLGIVHDVPDIGFRLDGADIVVLEALFVELRVQLLIDAVRIGFGAVAHEGDEGLAVVEGLGVLGDGFDDLVEVLVRGQERRTQFDGVELPLILVEFFLEVGVFVTVHQVGRLDDEGLDAVCHSAVEGLLNVVDGQVVSLFELVDDDLARERAADVILRVCFRDGIFDSADGLVAAVVVARAKADDQDGGRLIFLYTGIHGFGPSLFFLTAAGGERHQHNERHQKADELFEV